MKFEKQREILTERLGQEILAFDLRNNIPYVFNPMAAIIFSLIGQNLSPEEIAARLSNDYEIHFQAALKDVDDIIRDLVQKGILISIHSSC